MIFISFLNISQYLQCFLRCSRVYYNLLETTFQSTILFNVFPIFIQSCCSNTLYFTSGKCRFQHIGCIQRSCCASRTNDCVNFINKQNDVRVFGKFIQYSFNTLFELSAIFCACHYRSHI